MRTIISVMPWWSSIVIWVGVFVGLFTVYDECWPDLDDHCIWASTKRAIVLLCVIAGVALSAFGFLIMCFALFPHV